MGRFFGDMDRQKVINKVVAVDVDRILANPAQPRVQFDMDELRGLADSIRHNGILQPLTIRRNRKGEYELISGERRLRAAKISGLEKVPCIVVDTSDRNSAILALMENIQRQDLNFFEEAKAIENLIIEWNITQEEASLRLGKAQSTIANKMRILRLPKYQQTKIIEAGLTERHARALLKISDEEMRDKVIYMVSVKKLNVKQTEEYIRKLMEEEKRPHRTVTPVIKDVRIFLNTINGAIDMMKKSGVKATTEKVENEGYIEYIVRIPTTKA